MNKETEEKLALSLTAETTELIPFLPYLLQDLWELGSSPDDMIRLLKKHLPISKEITILDLACGKGAVSVKAAKELQIQVKGIDILPAFVAYAEEKASEYKVKNLCQFVLGDIHQAVNVERNYDCVILGAIGNVLGNPMETLEKLKKTIKPNGYILLDDCYLLEEKIVDVQYQPYEYTTHQQWMEIFAKADLKVIEEIPSEENDADDTELEPIRFRAHELMKLHPEKKDMFEQYVQSQSDEIYDLENNVVGVTWLLQKIE